MTHFQHAMIRTLVPSLFVGYYITHRHHVHAKCLPCDFHLRMEKLNEQDKKLHESSLKVHMIEHTPSQYHPVLQKLDEKTIASLDFIRIMYDKPLKPYQRVRVRRTIVDLIDAKDWSNDELEYFMYVLKFYDCLE